MPRQGQMKPKREPRVLAVAMLGILGSFSLVACGWYGIRLLMLDGPPLRRDLWPPYLLLLAAIVVSLAIMYWSFRTLERWGVRPPA